MGRKLRWGLLSTARINRALIPAIRKSKQNGLVAVASRDEDKARIYAAEWGIPRWFGSYEAMLADPDIDVIYNPLPNNLHAEWTIAAARQGKHVLCEKPLALSLAGIDQMSAAAQEHQVVIMEAFMYRHHPQTLKIMDMIRAGEIGEVRHISGSFSFFLERPGDIRWVPEYGGGSLWDVGCYPVSFARMVMGENPVEVYGRSDPAPSGVDLSFTGLLSFGNGATARIFSSFGVPFQTRIEIVGTKGILYTDGPFKPRSDAPLYRVKNGKTERIRTPMPELYLGEVEDLSNAVLTGAAQRLPLSESRDIHLILKTLLDSAAQGRPLSL